jgi:hypothetical protein
MFHSPIQSNLVTVSWLKKEGASTGIERRIWAGSALPPPVPPLLLWIKRLPRNHGLGADHKLSASCSARPVSTASGGQKQGANGLLRGRWRTAKCADHKLSAFVASHCRSCHTRPSYSRHQFRGRVCQTQAHPWTKETCSRCHGPRTVRY